MNESGLSTQIHNVERKLEIRRDRMARHLHEARTEAESRLQTGMKWAPLIVAGALGAAAFTVGKRHRPHSEDSAPLQHVNGHDSNGSHALATAAAVAGAVARAALSPQVHELWRMWQSSRERRAQPPSSESSQDRRF